ncbi:AMP-binding protein [Neohortaea acidophila]|uniref:AMP-binding protein n=1 Tax=Neohortaea acidophila TaxID=245834 RepID=A0A6A6PLN3_9PEZI|nr:AMP-binding protein [Neohortaea acidophila]KAF2480892.1 AMP-binding protein [Neohortaea acidophila]
MASIDDPELQNALQQLDLEYEEGEITQKGYEKRRTAILSGFLTSQQLRQLRETGSPGSSTFHSPSASIGSGHAKTTSYGSITDAPYTAYSPQGNGNAAAGLSVRPPSPSYQVPPPSQVQRFQEQQLGMKMPPAGQRLASLSSTEKGGSSYSSPESTMVGSGSYAFRPDMQQPGWPSPDESRQSTMLDSAQQGYFSDFTGQQQVDDDRPRESYGGPQRYSQSEALSPSAIVPPPFVSRNDLPIPPQHQLPLEPRDVPFAVYDPNNVNLPMSSFDNIAAVMRHRGKMQAKHVAYWVVDPRGKEVSSITWDKFASRAEKVAQLIRDKSNLNRADRVALVYKDSEVIDFAIALMGCFIAGVVAVPINNVDDYAKLSLLLATTQTHLALTTDNNLRTFQRDIANQKLKWPAGVEWWKTNEFGSYSYKKKDEGAALHVPDLAYIEFSRAPTGDLRGVVLSHRTIMHQMACVSAIIATIPGSESMDTFSSTLRNSDGSFIAPRPGRAETIISYLDPREGVGLILGVLLGVYGGHTTVWMESRTVDTPGIYANLITRYRATIMVADYPGLKRAAYNYQQDPMATRNFKKGMEPNFSAVKLCLIDTLTVDTEFHEILADRWLKPMRNPRARQLVAPMLCLPEHGGMIVSVRDWLGGEENMGFPLSIDDDKDHDSDDEVVTPTTTGANGFTSLLDGSRRDQKHFKGKRSKNELSELLLDKESLKTNEVVVLATGDDAIKRSSEPGTVRVGAFGYPIPDATVALVDPETNLLCPPYTIGEIWVDSPSLSGGFWALPKHTENIFHARPYRFVKDSPTPVLVEPEFLRTGLLGCIIEGKIYVLGLYEDRIRQRVEWVEHGQHEIEHRYFFVQHLVVTVMKTVPRIYDCSAFDVHVNGEYLPIFLIETQAASTAPTTTGGAPNQLKPDFLDALSERVMEVLYQVHHLRIYCVMMTAPNTLPRIVKNGRPEIGNMLCRKEFENGNLPCVHVKFGVERAVQNLPLGDDPVGGVWSPQASQVRMNMLALHADKQYSGVDHREVVIDDRTSTPLNQFSNIHDLMQWRVSRQPEELSYCSIDSRGREGKGVNWKKLDLRVAAVATYLKNKARIQPGDHVLLMYTHSEDFVFAVHACICLGAVAIPMAPIDQNRLNEDVPALLHVINDYRVRALIVNGDVDSLLRLKPVSQHLKQSALILKIQLPPVYNTTKPSKQSHGCRELGLTIRPAWIQPGHPVLVWIYWTPDQRRIAVQLGHNTIMALCKIQKETCQMTSTRPLLGCVRSTISLGFLHTCLMGIFLACPTYLVSPVDFAGNPNILFQTLSRYKIKDTYATAQMLDHAIGNSGGRAPSLHELKNLMISTDQRPRIDVYQRVKTAFAQSNLERTAINTIFSHVLNPMVASRSYMCIEPIELYLDPQALRRGLVVPVDPDQEPFALLVQDSGMVPVSTQISIVNPETNRLCLVGEYGEIWVQSEANAHGFYGKTDPIDNERFNGHTIDGDPQVRYVRTGDLGFLHTVNRPIGPGGNMVEMQVLFVLGSIGETFEVNGLQHFPMDIESSVEKSHRALVRGGCAIFQAGSLLVLVAEVRTRAYLASLVPIIVNTVLNEHQLVLDIVAFVGLGEFPRSRLGEKQRGKILGNWVSGRKGFAMAQFSIRDADSEGSVGTVVPDESGLGRRGSGNSARAGGGGGSLRQGGGSSLRHMESLTSMPVYEDLEGEAGGLDHQAQFPAGGSAVDFSRNDLTPTNEGARTPPLNTTLDYSPIRQHMFDGPDEIEFPQHPRYMEYQYQNEQMREPESPADSDYGQYADGRRESQISVPYMEDNPMWQQGGGLRVANRGEESDDWERDALRSMDEIRR